MTASRKGKALAANKQKKTKKQIGGDKPDLDGTVLQARRIRTGTTAIANHKVRCRPGTFEWRYGRFGNSSYHAGTTFAQLWERAGIAKVGGGIPQPSHSEKGSPGTYSDPRLVALEKVRRISEAIGGPMQRRLVAYCVEGRTPKEIAATYHAQVTDRQVSDTLDLDLIELARAMGFHGEKAPPLDLSAEKP